MSNPFEVLENRLSNIEQLLIELKEQPKKEALPDKCNVKEAAVALKVSEQTIHNYIKKGFLPAQQLGRILLIKRSDIDAALNDVKSLKYKRS